MFKLNNTVIKPTIFPDGTSQIWKLPDTLLKSDRFHIEWNYESEAEVMQLVQLRCLLHAVATIKPVSLYIDYLPYARQDKLVSNEATFALYPFGLILNMYPYESIGILDPHSNMATKIIKNSEAIYPIEKVKSIVEELKSEAICFPDKGALSKYVDMYNFAPAVYGEKIRDQLTGNILQVQLRGDVAGKSVLITDDICDGGRTFIYMAKCLYSAGATEVNLFVTHGLFSKGIQVLKDANIKRIFSNKGEHVS